MSALKGLTWSASNSVVSALIDVIRIAILVRFIVPEDFGLFAIALIVVGFCQLFSEGGIGNAVVSQENISRQQAGSVVNFSLLMGIVIYLMVFLLTPLIAGFYDADKLNQVLPLLMLVIPVSSLSRILQAMLQRELDMASIAKASLAGKSAGLLSAWWLAVQGQGIYALVWSSLIAALVTFVYSLYKAKSWVSFSFVIKQSHISPILGFSLYQLGEFTLNFFARNFDVLIITKLLGAEISGVYVVCKNLLTKGGDIIVSTFARYFHPSMSKVQGEHVRRKILFLQFFRSVSVCILVAYSLVIINAQLIVNLLLGEKFNLAYVLMPVMAFWLILRYWTAPVATLWLVRQKPQIGLYWNIMVASVIPAGIWMVSSSGIFAVLNLLIGLQATLFILSLFITFYLLGKEAAPVVQQILWLVIIGVPVGALAAASVYYSPGAPVELAISAFLMLSLCGAVVKRRALFFEGN